MQGDAVKDFAARLGISLGTYDAEPANSSYAGNQTFLGLLLAKANIPRKERLLIVRSLPERGRFLPSQDEARAFLSHFAAANERLAREWRPLHLRSHLRHVSSRGKAPLGRPRGCRDDLRYACTHPEENLVRQHEAAGERRNAAVGTPEPNRITEDQALWRAAIPADLRRSALTLCKCCR